MKLQILFGGLLVTFALFVSSYAQDEIVKVRRSFDIPVGGEFFVELDIDAGEVEVARNDRGNEIAVAMQYTQDEFEYDFDFSEKNRTLEISFQKKSWIKKTSDQTHAKMELLLPPEVPVDFSGRIKAGEIDMKLGDLSLKRFAFKTWAGEVRIAFDAPNRLEMNSFEMKTKIGETKLKKLGNARFHYADINNGIGQLDIDFSGALSNDAVAYIDLDIGETDIDFPVDLGVKFSVDKFLFLSQLNISSEFSKNGRYFLSENYERAEKNFEVKIAPGIGELNIRRR